MLTVTQNADTLTVTTGAGRLQWDGARGGLPCALDVQDELFSHALVPDGGLLADIVLSVEGSRVALSTVQGRLEVTGQDAGCVRFTASSTLLDGRIDIRQEYEVHAEGAVFCNFMLEVPSGRDVALADVALEVGLDTRDCRTARWGYYQRGLTYKTDYSTVHALPAFQLSRRLDEGADEPELMPLLSLDLGWDATRFFSSHIEFVLEDWTSYTAGMLERTRTEVAAEGGAWRAAWHFHEGPSLRVQGPHAYRNRWALLLGRARTRSGPDADPAVRNNALGCKICHTMYPYAREGTEWPWVSMPIKQVPAQPPQLFKGNPTLERVREAKEFGADLMIVHQYWMRNPGSNCEPVADYQVNDPDWARAFVAACHEQGMRVAFYVRGTEMWQQYASFFEDYLQQDRDGLYADWNSAFSVGFSKCSSLHVSAHNYFHFTKAQRRRVGPGGILIGHAGGKNLLSSVCFDAILGGEVSVRHDELLGAPESAAYYAQLNSSASHLISGYLPDREEFSGPRATAMCAAFGMTSHPFMEPHLTFAQSAGFIKPLWDAMNRLPGRVTQLHNPAYIPTRAVCTEAPHLFPSLWQDDAGKALLLVTNLGTDAQSGVVELDLAELDVPATAAVRVADVPATSTAVRVDGTAVHVEGMAPLQFAALLIG